MRWRNSEGQRIRDGGRIICDTCPCDTACCGFTSAQITMFSIIPSLSGCNCSEVNGVTYNLPLVVVNPAGQCIYQANLDPVTACFGNVAVVLSGASVTLQADIDLVFQREDINCAMLREGVTVPVTLTGSIRCRANPDAYADISFV